jgi:Spy/CpxP family protein refolding chaperone
MAHGASRLACDNCGDRPPVSLVKSCLQLNSGVWFVVFHSVLMISRGLYMLSSSWGARLRGSLHLGRGGSTAVRLLAVLLLASAAPLGAQSSFAWWKSDQFKKDLGLNPDQAARIDAIYHEALPKLRQSKGDLDQQEAELSRLIAGNVDETQIARQIDRVEATRAGLNKMRTLMLFHMRQVLTPEQNAKLKGLVDKWMQEHPRHSGTGESPPCE